MGYPALSAAPQGVLAQTALAATTAAQRSAHFVAMAGSWTQAQKDAVLAALTEQWHYAILTADYTLTSQTAAQKLFNIGSGSGGALTLPTGVYEFEAMLYITGMSATSGNGQFGLVGAGSATLANIFYHPEGHDAAAGINSAGTMGGGFAMVALSAGNVLPAATNTEMAFKVSGTFNVTVTGTIIPSIGLTTAAAAVVKANSEFRCLRIGPTGTTVTAAWS